MRLKQFMFALTAMLLSFVSVNAQEGIVAKIGNSEYTTFANAMTDANAATGNVTVEVYGAVEFIDGMELNGSYTAITFTGMSTGAKITINQTAGGDYLTAHGKTVAFNNLILAKANPAWSGNSDHMGNYFSIQGGTVTYTDCTFPNGACTSTGTAVYNNCTFQNASEYGLWVYDDALVTVNGGTIDSTKGIKVYSEGEDSVTSTLTVQNATFTENVTAKPAVAVGYAQSITLIGNTYNNTTAHVELDSGSDADCDGIAFVAEDSEGNDISSELTVVDRSNSSAACGVLVDGKIYTTVTTAAAEATSGSTVTLLYSTTETVELPEGVTLDTNGFTADNVTVEVSLAGEGTEASPYLISSVADLETLRNKVNAGNSYEGQFVKLAADLTLTEAWTPIGDGTRSSKSYSGNAFKGTFDGNNKTISGLKITSTTGNDAAIGLFGVVDGGTVKNLTLNDVDINVANSNLAGGAIGLMLGGATAENITVNGEIVGNDGVGGIVGRLVINGTIKDCTNNASVTSSYGGIGGIVGKAYYEDGANTTIFASIDNCTNNGTVTAPMYVGGIVGLARANVTDCVNNGPVVGGTQTGGIIGQLIAAGTVSGNENKAKITGTNHLGGIIGDYSQSSAYTYYNVAITSNINRGELAATEQCAAIMGCNNIDGFTAMTATGNVSYYFVEGLELFGNPEDMVIDDTNKFISPVAKIGDVEYETLAEAVAVAQAGDEIVLLVDVAEDATLPAGVKFNGNGKAVGNLIAGGEITFTGVTKATSFGVEYTNTTVNIVPGASLEITGTGRMVIGHGCTFNITGSIEDAKTADVADLTPSLIMPGASFTGAGVTFNVTNAYIKATAYCSSKNSYANGTFNFNVTNSVWEQANTLVFSAPTNSMDPTFNLNLVNSVLNSTSHLVFAVTKGEIVIDNSNVNVGTARQIENRSTMTIKNGSVVNGAVATSENAKNPGTLIVENATYAVTGEFSGSDLGTGTLIVKKGATVSAGSITNANIQIDATGMAAGDVINLTANLSNLAGTIEVINNDNLDASIVDGKIVLAVKPVAKIGDVEYYSLQEALDAAAAGTGNVTVTILSDVDLTGIDWNPVTVSAAGYPVVTVEGNNKTITGLNDMLFAGTWAGKSGLIIKDLTIANSSIVNDKDDAAGTVGVGAFIGFPQASATITLENCHLKNSSVEGGHWTGGLIGYAAGYAGEDGPVFMNLTVKNCSVTGSTITGKGSVGGIIGHGSGNGWTNVVIEETTVKDNTITSTGSSNVKAGAVMGTIGAAGQPTTANGVTKTGGASVSATVAGNTVKSNNTVITTIYGRQGTETGMLYVAGGSYDNYPIEQGVAYAAPVEGYVIVKNDDNTYGLDEKVELPEVEITDIKGLLTDSDPDLTFALNFTIKDLENLDEEYLNKVMEQYGSWYTDYVLTISGLTDENVTFNANGNGDGYLAGQYDGFGPNWVSVPFENVTLANNESIYIMEYAAKLMGQSGLRYTLAEIVSIVMDFDCGVYFTPEFLTANPGLKVDLHLKVFTEDAEGNKVNDINVATNNFDVEDYVAIVHADGKQTAYCTTLAEAVAAAEADETITLIADVELTETLNIPAGKTIALDLNGKTISQTKEQTAGYQMILNDGNLTINDSSEAKTGKISYTDSGNGGEYISDVIYNRSVLVINGGTIENLSSATVASNGYPHAVDTYSGIRDTYVEINGGTIYCAEYSAIRMFCVSATNKADLVINGGTIKGAIDMQNGTKNLALGTLTINDGTFETTKNANNIRFANWNGGATEYGISAEIKGGSFNGGITTAYVPAAANWDKGVITGGTFAKDMTEYCAEGFVCEANGDGTYGIVADPSYIAEFTIDDANPEDYTSDLAGMKVGKLTYKRTFIAGIWNPMFVPFEIDVERLVNEFGLEVASYNQMISSEQADGSIKYTMEVKHRTSGKVSHYPLFVRTEDSYELEYVAEDVVLSSADEFVITTNSVANTFKLHGTHQAKTKEDLAGMYAIGATTGLWTPSSSGIKPHRLYFEILDNSNDPFASSVPAKSIRIVVEGEDGTTGVDEIVGENAEEMIFDLQGRRVLEPQKGGLYIINGKKVIF